MARYETKVSRPRDRAGGEAAPAGVAPPEPPACRTCPFWRDHNDGTGLGTCHAGIAALAGGRGLFATTDANDWCARHPAAPGQ